MKHNLNKEFWTERYKNNETGWDIGHVSTPIKEYIDQLNDKSIKILIPGAGNSYEAEYLFNNGFKNIYVLDISELPLKNLKTRIPEIPEEQLVNENFFNHTGQYDLIIEQTFFCAIDPSLRQKYAEKMQELLKPNGKIVGLYFCFSDKPMNEGPPFNGTLEEYQNYFNKFKIKTFEDCHNSITPRAGNELFAILQKK